MDSREQPAWIRDLQEAIHDMAARLLQTSRDALRVAPMGELGRVADEIAKFRIDNRAGRSVAFAIGSSPTFPHNVALAMSQARVAREAVGSALGQAIIEPLGEAHVAGASVAILPYLTPLSARRPTKYLHDVWLSRPLRDWLRRVAEVTCRPLTDDEMETRYREPLRMFIDFPGVSSPLREQVAAALERLDAGAWRPLSQLMHGDFWHGNVLLRSDGRRPRWQPDFVIIDWPGLCVAGYPFFDLVRYAQGSFSVRWALARELQWYQQRFRMVPADVAAYLCAAHAALATNLNQFPRDRFLAMFARTMELVERATR